MNSIQKFFGNIFGNKKTRYGTFSMLTVMFVIGVLIAVNVVVAQVDTKIDMTISQLYSIGKQSKDLLKALDEDIVIYPLIKTGASDNASRVLTEMLDEYASSSPRIQIIPMDPYKNPTFLNDYVSDGASVPLNSVVVKSAFRNRVVTADKLFSINSSTGELVAVDVEARVTNAILYVAQENSPIIYQVAGHNEFPLSASLQDHFLQANYATAQVSLQSANGIPADCAVLMLAMPQRDYSEAEAQTVIEYLQGGGRAMIMADYNLADKPNFVSILEAYYIQPNLHMIYETDANRMIANDPQQLKPVMMNHEINTRLSTRGYAPIMAYTQGLEILPVQKTGAAVMPLMISSAQAFAKNNPESQSPNKEEGDLDGPFAVAVAVTDEFTLIDKKVTTKLIVTGTSALLSDSLNADSLSANSDWMISALDFLTDKTEDNTVYIPFKERVTPTLSPTESQALSAKIFAIGVLPGAVILAGAIIWLRRRNR